MIGGRDLPEGDEGPPRGPGRLTWALLAASGVVWAVGGGVAQGGLAWGLAPAVAGGIGLVIGFRRALARGSGR